MRISKVVILSVLVLTLGGVMCISFNGSFTSVEALPSTVSLMESTQMYQTSSETQPLFITSDSDFDGYGFPGTGHIDHPYIIENYIIDTPSTRPGIYVTGTTKHFVIRNCYFTNQEYGILIDTIADGTATISDNIAISNGQGFDIHNSNYLTISGNIADSNTYCGFILIESSHNILEGNKASNSNYGFCLTIDSNDNIPTTLEFPQSLNHVVDDNILLIFGYNFYDLICYQHNHIDELSF